MTEGSGGERGRDRSRRDGGWSSLVDFGVKQSVPYSEVGTEEQGSTPVVVGGRVVGETSRLPPGLGP